MQTTSPHRPITSVSASHLSRLAGPAYLLAALAVVAAAVFLRFYRLDGQSFWYDEGTSVVLAARDLPTIARDAAADIHPPLYYILLHVWTGWFGQSEVAARSLSALLGVILIGLTWAIGHRLFDRWTGLLGAGLLAVSPFAVYYAQEARMYTLAATFGAASFLSALHWALPSPRRSVALAAYVLTALGTLYSHYFAFTAPLAANLVVGLWILRRRAWRDALVWAVAQTVVAALFLPWLLQTLDGIQSWPAVSPPFTLDFLLADSLRVFSLGRGMPWSSWALLFAMLLVVGAFVPAPRRTSPSPPLLRGEGSGPSVSAPSSPPLLRGEGSGPSVSAPSSPPLLKGEGSRTSISSPSSPPSLIGKGDGGLGPLPAILYLLIPLVVMFLLSLRRPMYNPKFLLVALPPFALLVARGALVPVRWSRLVGGVVSALVILALLALSAQGLLGYYFDPRQARDDYRGIARYIQAAGRPGDAIILNAPAQAEPFGLYYQGDLPVYPLPRRRPPSKGETEAELKTIADKHGRIFGLFWATNESDPQGIIESWLGRNTYKAMDSWWGNLRLTLYAIPKTSAPWQPVGQTLGGQVTLKEAQLSADGVEAGDVLPVGLRWAATANMTSNVTVFVHLVNPQGVIIGQRDAPPGGRSTAGWPAGETRDDYHGVLVPFGTPPGAAEVRVGLYDAATGQRLKLANGADYISLGRVLLRRPAAPPPVEVFNLPVRSGAQVGDLTLLGLAAHKRGFDHAPETPIHPGDEVQVTLLWQARQAAPRLPSGATGVWLVLGDGAAQADATPGQGYPLAQWQAGEVVRATYILRVPPDLPPRAYPLRLGPRPEVELMRLEIRD